MLPLLVGTASKLLGPSGSTGSPNKKISKEKLLNSSENKEIADKVKVVEKKVNLLPPSRKINLLGSSDEIKNIDDKSTKERSIDNLKKKNEFIIKTLENIINFFKLKRKNESLEYQNERKQEEKERKKKKEEDLEEKKSKKNKKIGLPSGPKFSFLDSIINFFTTVLIGSFVKFLYNNSEKIFNMLEDISSGLNNIWDVTRISIISLSTVFRKQIRFVAKLGKNLLKGPIKITKSLFKKLGNSLSSLLKNVGKFVVNTIKRAAGMSRSVAGAASGVTRSTGVSSRTSQTPSGRPRRPVRPATPTTPRPTSPAATSNANKFFGAKGSKHLQKVSKIFKKIPFIGALIGIGIDLAMGERLDNAIAGAAGASLGSAIGAGVGSLIFPGLGTLAGGFVGGIVGDWAGKEIYKKLSGQVTQINPPPESTTNNQGAYSRSLSQALNQPLPGPSGTGTGMASGPGAEGLADFIAQAETGGRWNAYNGDWKYGRDDNISNLKLSELRSYMDTNHPNSSGAVGAYQFMPETAIQYAKQLGMDPNTTIFSPQNQKKIHLRHLKALGYDDFISGKISREKFGQNIAKAYRAVPDPYTGYTYDDQFKSRNKAQVTNQQFINALDRSKQQGLGTPPPAPVLPGPDGITPSMGTKTGLVTGYGGGTPFHIDTRWARDLPMDVVVPMIDSMAAALAADGRVMEMGQAGSVSGQRYPLNGSFEDKKRFLQSATAGHHTQRSMAAMDYFIPKSNEDRFGKSAEYANIPAPALPQGYKMTFHQGNASSGGAFYQITDPNGRVVFKTFHGDPSKSRLGLIGQQNTLQQRIQQSQQLRQQAYYEGQSQIVPIPIPTGGAESTPSIFGGGTQLVPIGHSKSDLLNSYYQSQLIGFLYKQG